MLIISSHWLLIEPTVYIVFQIPRVGLINAIRSRIRSGGGGVSGANQTELFDDLPESVVSIVFGVDGRAQNGDGCCRLRLLQLRSGAGKSQKRRGAHDQKLPIINYHE